MSRRVLRALTLGLSTAPLLACTSVMAGWFEPEAEPQQPPIHVYDYTRPPVWTGNGWAQVPIEVHFPRNRPLVVVPPQNVDPEPPPPRRVKAKRPAFEPVEPRYTYAPMPLPKLPPQRKNLTK